MAELNAFQNALAQFDKAVAHLNLERGIVELLRRPKRELTVNFPVKMDGGDIRIFTGFRVHHSTALGATKGGIRFHQDVTLDEVLAANPDQLATYLGGKATIEQWLFGQVMRRTQGRGNPQVIRRALREKLEALKQKRTQG